MDHVCYIVSYAPANEAKEQKKTDFYDLLQATVDNAKVNELVVVMGETDAKIGSQMTATTL